MSVFSFDGCIASEIAEVCGISIAELTETEWRPIWVILYRLWRQGLTNAGEAARELCQILRDDG